MTWVSRAGRTSVLLALLLVTPIGAAAQAQPIWRTDQRYVQVRSEGNELVVRRKASVACSTLGLLAAAIDRPRLSYAPAIRLIRTSPAEMTEYVLCIIAEGGLILGEHVSGFDFSEQRYVFVRGEMGRVYPRLERPGPWTWLVDIPLSREVSITLEVRVEGSRFPIESVTIDPFRAP